MFEDEIDLILQEFANEFRIAAKYYATQNLNSKGKDSLSNSNVLNDMITTVKDNKLTISLYKYIGAIETGRPIGYKGVPTDVLIKWIKRNNIKPRSYKKGKKGQFVKVTPTSINQLAFLIQRGIKKNGIKPRPFISRAYSSTVSLFNARIDNYINDFAKDVLFKFTKNK